MAADVLPPLYAVVDAGTASRHGWGVPSLAFAYLAGGARWLQIRAPGVPGGQLLEWCEEIVAAAAPHGATVIVNDRADIARLAGAAGVHLGQDDLAVATARRVLHEDAWVGRSTHSREQIAQAAAQDVSYIAVGPVFGTTTKVTGHAPVGMELVRAAVRACPGRPVVAIGGITLARARLVLEAGATAVAVISDLLATGDPEARVRAYVAALSPRAAGEPFAK